MTTGKEIVNKIQETLTREERCSNRITRGLRALEARCYPVAKQAAELALTDCEWIEQRMAALSIIMIAELKDDKVTETFLASAYDI